MDKIILLYIFCFLITFFVITSSYEISERTKLLEEYHPKICLIEPKNGFGFEDATFYAISPDESCEEKFEGLKEHFTIIE